MATLYKKLLYDGKKIQVDSAVRDGEGNELSSVYVKAADIGTTQGLNYLTTAPSSANTDGTLKLVVLNAEPLQKFEGFLYLIISNN